MLTTCAVVSISIKAFHTCAGVALFCAVAISIFVAGEGKRRDAHVWENVQGEIMGSVMVVFRR